MIREHYVLIRFNDKNANPFALSGRCIKVLHGFMHNYNLNNIGVTFPEWSEDNVGHSIAMVSSEASELTTYCRQKPMQIMRSHKLIEIEEVKDVPDNLPRIQFRRSLEAERDSLGDKKKRTRRAIKRARQRGEEYIYDTFQFNEDLPHHHRIPISSKTTDNEFNLLIERIYPVDSSYTQNESPFGRYGLSTKTKFHGTVPCLQGHN